MDLGLKGKSVLVTGGSKGIGLACAMSFAAEGCRVHLAARDKDRLAQASRSLGGDVKTHSVDLRDATALRRLAEECAGVDILINNAGDIPGGTIETLDDAKWRHAWELKVFGFINLTRELYPQLRKRKGVIVNVIGSGGKVATPTHLGGGAANAALMLATAGLANAYAARGVRVIGINPGPTKTERVAAGLSADAKRDGISEDEALKRIVQRMPMKRMPEPEEIADLIVFAASERARLLTGAILSADAATNPTVV
jgi:NAD(P)-dependent dehydrogenase (short-subunit alcohol dehydrogenase family)